MEQFLKRRRQLLALAAGTLCGGASFAAYAQNLYRTPAQALGPFYPETPLEKDADLVTVSGQTGIAKGEITHLSGRVLDRNGRPIKDVLVEVWQCNAYGRYHHPRDSSDRPLDPNFQGYGSTTTGDYVVMAGQVGVRDHVHIGSRAVLVYLATLALPLERLAEATSLISLVIFALVDLALIVIKLRDGPPPEDTFEIPLAVPVIGLLACFGLLAAALWL